MGRGLVNTSSDFGMLGAAPTHPPLLDLLAHDLREHDWSIKSLFREIISSRTFGLDSRSRNTSLMASDPDNDYWGRGLRRRLEGETLRDAMLSAAGVLNRKEATQGIRPLFQKRS